MKLNYTEFSYGYAFTENLIRSLAIGPGAAPVFPNLVQEALLGYDVKVDLPGVPLFFQFKLPELMVRKSVKEVKTLKLKGLEVPFYRMPLMRRDVSDQHLHLVNLEKSFPHQVFYATPALDGVTSFNAAYSKAAVHQTSAFFSPGNIGLLPDNKDHNVAYCPQKKLAWRCSEPQAVKARAFKLIERITSSRLKRRAGETIEDSLQRTREGVMPIVPSELRAAEGQVRERIMTRREVLRGDARSGDRTDDGPVDFRAGDAAADGRTVEATVELLVLRELVRVGLGVDLLMAQPRT